MAMRGALEPGRRGRVVAWCGQRAGGALVTTLADGPVSIDGGAEAATEVVIRAPKGAHPLGRIPATCLFADEADLRFLIFACDPANWFHESWDPALTYRESVLGFEDARVDPDRNRSLARRRR
jgi:hypothetical protein